MDMIPWYKQGTYIDMIPSYTLVPRSFEGTKVSVRLIVNVIHPTVNSSKWTMCLGYELKPNIAGCNVLSTARVHYDARGSGTGVRVGVRGTS